MHAYFIREGQGTREEHKDRDSVRGRPVAAGQRVEGGGGGGRGVWAWQMNGLWTQPFNFLYGFLSRYCTAIWQLATILVAISILLFSHLLKMGRQHHLHFCLYSRAKEQKQAGEMTTMSAGLSVERSRNPIITRTTLEQNGTEDEYYKFSCTKMFVTIILWQLLLSLSVSATQSALLWVCDDLWP